MYLDVPVAMVLPQAMGTSRPFASQVNYIFSLLGLVRKMDRSLPEAVHHLRECLPRNWGQLDPTHHIIGR